MTPLVYGLVLLAALMHASWNAILRGRQDRASAMGWMGLATFVVAAPLLPFVQAPAAKAWPFLLFSSSLHVIYMRLLTLTYRKGELSSAYPIARGTSPLLVALGAWLAAAEVPSIYTGIGIAMVSAGIIALARDVVKMDRTTVTAALLTGCCIACYTVSDGMGIRASGNPLVYNAWLFSIYGLGMVAVFARRRGLKGFRGDRRSVSLAIGGGVLSVLAYALVTTAMQHGSMGMVSALRETSVVFAAIIGKLLLGEDLRVRRATCCIAVAAGAVLLAR